MTIIITQSLILLHFHSLSVRVNIFAHIYWTSLAVVDPSCQLCCLVIPILLLFNNNIVLTTHNNFSPLVIYKICNREVSNFAYKCKRGVKDYSHINKRKVFFCFKQPINTVWEFCIYSVKISNENSGKYLIHAFLHDLKPEACCRLLTWTLYLCYHLLVVRDL